MESQIHSAFSDWFLEVPVTQRWGHSYVSIAWMFSPPYYSQIQLIILPLFLTIK